MRRGKWSTIYVLQTSMRPPQEENSWIFSKWSKNTVFGLPDNSLFDLARIGITSKTITLNIEETHGDRHVIEQNRKGNQMAVNVQKEEKNSNRLALETK